VDWRRIVIVVSTACAAGTACGGSGTNDDTADVGDRTSVASTTGPATAPEQTVPDRTAVSTVVAPELPPLCGVDELTFAVVAPDEVDVLLIEIANAGPARCEANLSASVGADADMEPDVWLEAAASAELRVELDTTSCDAPAPVDTIGLDMNGEPVAVAIERVDVCSLALTALYPR
jgi:hypothetical protein